MNQTCQADATSAIAMISANMLQQIIALQEVINSREPRERFPTLQEAGLITKMITGLEKLKRFLAPPRQADPAKKNGTRSKKGKDMMGDLNGLYQMQLTEDDAQDEDFRDADDPATIPAQHHEITPSAPGAVPFPILEHEFAEYQHLFDDTRGDRSSTTMVKGVAYGTNWLQYNLYQYCLPPQERRFFYNEARYHHEIAHYKVSWLIEGYLRRQKGN